MVELSTSGGLELLLLAADFLLPAGTAAGAAGGVLLLPGYVPTTDVVVEDTALDVGSSLLAGTLAAEEEEDTLPTTVVLAWEEVVLEVETAVAGLRREVVLGVETVAGVLASFRREVLMFCSSTSFLCLAQYVSAALMMVAHFEHLFTGTRILGTPAVGAGMAASVVGTGTCTALGTGAGGISGIEGTVEVGGGGTETGVVVSSVPGSCLILYQIP